MGYQVEQYTTAEVVTGLTTVQGQLVMVRVVDYIKSVSISRCSTRLEVARW